MDDGKVIWSKWQSLLTEFQPLFTRGGWVRFVQWVTGMAFTAGATVLLCTARRARAGCV